MDFLPKREALLHLMRIVLNERYAHRIDYTDHRNAAINLPSMSFVSESHATVKRFGNG